MHDLFEWQCGLFSLLNKHYSDNGRLELFTNNNNQTAYLRCFWINKPITSSSPTASEFLYGCLLEGQIADLKRNNNIKHAWIFNYLEENMSEYKSE